MIEKCSICGRDKKEYDSSWPCKQEHDWRGSWRKDKTSPKYQTYLKKRHQSMTKMARKKLEELNKKTPPEYLVRKR